LTGTGSLLLHQARPDVPGSPALRDGFGFSLAAGNLGRGPQADLAVGVWMEDVVGDDGAGGVNVFYATSSGLQTTGSQLWTQDTADIADVAEQADRFGYAVAVGNFGRGPQADLAVGVPFQELGAADGAGVVNAIYGSADGLTADGNQLWSQATDGVFGTTELNDYLGFRLAAGNVGRGGQADLVIGVPGEAANGEEDAGVTHLLYGTKTGLTADGSQLWYQGTQGVAGEPEEGDQLGMAIAIGNFGNGATRDLALGVPTEDLGSIQAAGAVNVLYGSSGGITTTGNEVLSQNTDGTDEAAESGDLFGETLATS
jgi:hypothetical protein